MLSFYKKIFILLDGRDKKRLYGILFLSLFASILEALGAASVMPFFALASSPELFDSYLIKFRVYEIFSEIDSGSALIIVGYVSLIVFTLSLVAKALVLHLQIRFALLQEWKISEKLFHLYTNQDFSWFLANKPSEMSKNILSDINYFINQSLLSMIVATSQIGLVVILITLLLILTPGWTLIIASIFIGTYLILHLSLKNLHKKIGASRTNSNTLRFKFVNEAFMSIKILKLYKLEDFFCSHFSEASKNYATTQSFSQSLTHLPRFIIEGIAFGGMLLFVIISAQVGDGFLATLPIFVLIAYAGYKILPALQQIYVGFSSASFAQKSLTNIQNDFLNLKKNLDTCKNQKHIEFQYSIKVRNLKFNYPNKQSNAVDIPGLEIARGQKIGFVGRTGSGKTTLVDLLIGIVQPTAGSILIDDKPLSEEYMFSWQQKIGYVPQSVYLTDDSILSNVAFGADVADLNYELLSRVCEIACLNDFVKDLPHGLHTRLGEHGGSLSGGEKQRIGLARALYRQPEVLILDEATSALDPKTESKVLKNLKQGFKDITIFSIAHRLNTVIDSDCIFLLEKGEIVSYGTYDQLSKNSTEFQALLRAA